MHHFINFILLKINILGCFWGVGFRLANCKIYCLNYRFDSEPITQQCTSSICSAIRLVHTKKN